MRTLILDGAQADDVQALSIRTALRQLLPEAEVITLREQRIGNCAGDFFCWVRSPGMCNTNDDNRLIAAKIVQSDRLIHLTPITFGGYAAELKRMVDHQIQNISPFFATVNGEIHHQRRYAHYPDVLTIGWQAEANPAAEAIFRHLVHRNALNLYAQTSVCGVITGQPTHADLQAQVQTWLQALADGPSSPMPALPVQPTASLEPAPIKRAVLLVGSPRTKQSTSASLGGYLVEQLEAKGVETQTIQLYTSLNSPARLNALFEAVGQADLVVLAFPLYVDSLPSPVMATLEKLAARRSHSATPIRFAAIANCGFPEAHHNYTALAICAEFARQTGWAWLGGLALGGGEGLVHGVPLNQMDGRAIPIKQALNLAAAALADGQSIPPAARNLLAKSVIPNWLYKFFGGFGWKQQAKRYGMEKALKRQPYAVK